MRRRDLFAMLSGIAVLRSLAARAQAELPVVGYINAASPDAAADLVGAFRQGLSEAGYSEGRNVAIEYRWAEGHYDRLPRLAADLVADRVTVIAATSTPVALAAKGATGTIPMVFTIGGDPVKVGLVPRLNRPDGNLTGVTRYNVELAPKRLELLHELVPGARKIGLVVNPGNPNTKMLSKSVLEAAQTLGVELHLVSAENDNELDSAFATLSSLGVDAVAIGNDSFFNSRSERLAELVLHRSLPAVYQYRRFVEAGGLMSYGVSNTDSHHRLGAYVGRILAGAKPADLPVEQSTKVDFLVNLKTAKALGLTIPPLILARADEVIE